MSNSWLARQRKSELVELAQSLGLKDYESLRKSDLELAIDEHISENAAQYQSDPRFQDYFRSRARAGGSPVKKEPAAPEMKVSRRRAAKPVEETKPADDIAAEDEQAEGEDDDAASRADSTSALSLTRTPARALALANRLQLPATPADVAQAVDRSTVAVRERVATLYAESGLTEATQTTRAWLSTVESVLSAIALFELYRLRRELLPDRYAFTVPAVPFLGTPDYPVHLPDMFALLTAAFWGPALTWALTSLVLPGLFGYFFNLSAAHSNSNHHRSPSSSSGRGGGSSSRGRHPEYAVDPLTFSVVKAAATYMVYAQGVTFGGIISPDSVSRINSALYSGWRGVLAGTAVSGLAAVYDAVLRK